ncbi:MAG TPA: M6 family metalloprotease domain-containing protein [Polyangiaceae bacterium]|nr:M6 family metalloprotease domain-containing protein [Polyangiaceae bacterium]
MTLPTQSSSSPHRHERPCFVAPDPELLERKEAERESALKSFQFRKGTRIVEPTEPGLNDGVVRPLAEMDASASFAEAATAAAERAPLRGQLNVVVVLVEFSDKKMGNTKADFERLFFSKGEIATGSVAEYFADVSHGLISISGKVVGPYELPQTIKYYADGSSGKTHKVKEMARDALSKADPDIDFATYDNDKDGYVDAFVVVHAGRGAEQTDDKDDIWSHKWVLPQSTKADGVNVYAYLTIPEDARLGVSAHELGHLLFGWPDLYDSDYSSRGVGDFCLMGGGSWLGGGDTPCHPSAWCKSTQGWASVATINQNETRAMEDIKTGHSIARLWTEGKSGAEYFLAEVRFRSGYDQLLPAEGLLLWHIDESVKDNKNEQHLKVALVQADGRSDLERKNNSGDQNDAFPGGLQIVKCDKGTNPSTKAYSGADTKVALSGIQAQNSSIHVKLNVRS